MNIGSNLRSRTDTTGTTFNSSANPYCCGRDTLDLINASQMPGGKRLDTGAASLAV